MCMTYFIRGGVIEATRALRFFVSVLMSASEVLFDFACAPMRMAVGPVKNSIS